MSQFSVDRKDEWKWKAMIHQPALITASTVAEAREAVRKKKNPPALDALRFETFTEGQAAQILHVGPFSEEGPTIERLHAAIAERGGTLSGKHHEIYLSDIRRAAPGSGRR